MLCRSDIAELWNYRGGEAVSVVQHAYTPRPEDKFLGQRQSIYEKKNWSSLMLFDNEQCRLLQPELVGVADGLYLHQFKWAPSVGSVSVDWNHLVSEYAPNPEAKLVHFTRGGPWFAEYDDCEFAQEWDEERGRMNYRSDGVANSGAVAA